MPLSRIDAHALFDASPNPYVLLDPQLRIVAANRAYLAVTMREAGTLIGRPLFEAFPSPPESIAGQQLRQSLARVLREGCVDHLPSIHYPIARPDGGMDSRWWSATHTPLPGPQGGVAFVLQHTQDVTELVQLRAQASGAGIGTAAQLHRRAEAVAADNLALGQQRDVLRQLFEQTPGFTAVLRGPGHVFELVNPGMQQLLGERPLLGLPVRQALPELAEQGFFDLLDQAYASGEPHVGHDVQALLQRQPGAPLEARRTDFIFQPLRDGQGQVNGILVQGHDLTGQVLAQRAAAGHAARFETLSHSVPNQVWTAQADGALDWCNAQAYTYSGVAPGTLVGHGWIDIVHPDDRALAGAAWQQALASGQPYLAEFRLRRHDGVYRWHLARALAVRGDDGQIQQWVGTNTDIDDQKAGAAMLADLNNLLAQRVDERTAELTRTQEALRHSQKMEAIGNLAGGIAHDFNNLLQVISGNLQLLQRALADRRDGAADNDAAALLARAQGGVARGAKLAAQLLAFGRRQPLVPEVLNIGRLIRGMDDMLRSSLGEAVEIDTVVAGGLWHTQVDPGQVENALLNLALNARDAMAGRGKLTIEAGNAWLDDRYSTLHDEVRPGQYVMVAVTDTGAGMTPQVLERAFEPFFTTKPAGKGTGLGLSMVYGFVKQSGGHVKVYSEPGSGTTVRLYLPRSQQPEDRPVLTDHGPAEGGSDTILVAEDDEAVRETTVGLLKDLGYRVLTARDALGALTIIDSGAAIDLLFTDVVMPGPLKSTELARKAQLRLPGLAVLFTSGYTENAIVHGGRLDAGVQLLSKPYTREALARKVRQVLRREAAAPPGPAASAGARAPRTADRDLAEDRPLQVLLCEDDALVRDTLVEVLADLGCQVQAAASAAQARQALLAAPVQLLITDLGLPDGDGQALARWARQQQPGLVVALVSGQLAALQPDQLVALQPDQLAATQPDQGAGTQPGQPGGTQPGLLTLAKPFDIDALTALLQQVRQRLAASG